MAVVSAEFPEPILLKGVYRDQIIAYMNAFIESLRGGVEGDQATFNEATVRRIVNTGLASVGADNIGDRAIFVFVIVHRLTNY